METSRYTAERAVLEFGLPAVLIVFALLVFSHAVPRLRRSQGLTSLGRLVMPGLFLLAMPPMIAMGIGPALLALSGVVLRIRDGNLTADFLREDFLSGSLALRVSSLIIAYHLVVLYAHKKWNYLDFFDKSEDRSKAGQRQIAIQTTGMQFLFYGLCAACLWYHYIYQVHTTTATVLSWALIFILDDWSIVSYYLVDRSIVPGKFLYYKVATFNILLAATSFVVFREVNNWALAFFYFIPTLVLLAHWVGFYAVLRQRALAENAWAGASDA